MSSDADSVPLGYARDIFDLSGRVAVITGGGGLGRAIAIGYAQVGVTMVVADINEEGAAETRATIGSFIAYPLSSAYIVGMDVGMTGSSIMNMPRYQCVMLYPW